MVIYFPCILQIRDFINIRRSVSYFYKIYGGLSMNQILIGKFIALRRKGKNLTQEQLAEKLGVSNKTISKWENGKCMPDYSIVKNLCEELDITVAELIDGKVSENDISSFNEEQILNLMKRTQELEKQKDLQYGIMLIIMGVALQALSYAFGGSDFKDFLSGLLLGLSVAEMLVGLFVVGKYSRK